MELADESSTAQTAALIPFKPTQAGRCCAAQIFRRRKQLAKNGVIEFQIVSAVRAPGNGSRHIDSSGRPAVTEGNQCWGCRLAIG